MNRSRVPLTPGLLGQFAKLGVTTAGGQALPEAPAQLSTHELKERGWTPAMIAQLLPESDATRANHLTVGPTKKALAAPVKLYDLARVVAAEAQPEFRQIFEKAAQHKAAGAKGVLTRAQRREAYVDGYTPQLLDPPAPLTGADLWGHHLRELTTYEREHASAFFSLGPTAQRKASRDLYNKHHAAFRAKFGTKY